jgi:hypothetical protein
MRSLLQRAWAAVSEAEGVGERSAGSVDADVVDGPAIDCDGTDAFFSDRRAFTQALFDAVDDAVEVPTQAAIDFVGVVGEAVDELDGGAAVGPAEQGNAAALRAQIDGDRGAGVGGDERAFEGLGHGGLAGSPKCKCRGPSLRSG